MPTTQLLPDPTPHQECTVDGVRLALCVQVVTAKSSEVNLVLVAADPTAEDVVEHPVPEQFISTFKDGKLITTAASHGGG